MRVITYLSGYRFGHTISPDIYFDLELFHTGSNPLIMTEDLIFCGEIRLKVLNVWDRVELPGCLVFSAEIHVLGDPLIFPIPREPDSMDGSTALADSIVTGFYDLNTDYLRIHVTYVLEGEED